MPSIRALIREIDFYNKINFILKAKRPTKRPLLIVKPKAAL